MTDHPFDARFIERDAQPSLAVRLQMPMADVDMGAVYDRELPRLFARLQELGAEMAGAPYGRYFAWGDDEVDVEIGLVLTRPRDDLRPLRELPAGDIGASELPAGSAAVVTHWGPYDGLPTTYGRLHDWIHEQGREDTVGPWESYLTDPGTVTDPADLQTEICYPVA